MLGSKDVVLGLAISTSWATMEGIADTFCLPAGALQMGAACVGTLGQTEAEALALTSAERTPAPSVPSTRKCRFLCLAYIIPALQVSLVQALCELETNYRMMWEVFTGEADVGALLQCCGTRWCVLGLWVDFEVAM